MTSKSQEILDRLNLCTSQINKILSSDETKDVIFAVGLRLAIEPLIKQMENLVTLK